MADRGFNIQNEVQFYQAKLAIPNFTHGKKPAASNGGRKDAKNCFRKDPCGKSDRESA